jgi:hypothetical protein
MVFAEITERKQLTWFERLTGFTESTYDKTRARLRESTIDPDTRRLVQLTVGLGVDGGVIEGDDGTTKVHGYAAVEKTRRGPQGMAGNQGRSGVAGSLSVGGLFLS